MSTSTVPPALPQHLQSKMSSRGSGRREDWKEYVDSEGKTYYYNVITKEVTWIKPRVLIGKGESQKGEWKEFTTAEGKVYYHNALTGETTWTRPPEMRASGPDRMAQDDAISSLLGADSALGGPDDYFDSATRKERTQAFHSLLEEYDIDPELPWVEALKKIINDPRYRAFKTLGERKASFHEYCEKQRKTRRERHIIDRKRSREEFMAMLESCHELRVTTPWKRAREYFQKDRRMHAIESDREREALYEDYIIMLERKAKDLDKIRRKAKMEKFRELLEETKSITVQSQWRKVQELLDMDARFQSCDKMDRLIVFEDYLKELEQKEEETKIREKEGRKRQQRMVREEFRALLRDYSDKGLLDYTTKWQDFAQLVASDPVFGAIMKQGVAQDMFDDFIDELEDSFRKEYKQIKQALERLGYTLQLGVEFASFEETLKSAKGLDHIGQQSIRLAYDALYAKEEEKEREREHKRQKGIDRLFAALNTIPEITAETTYAEAQPLIEGLPGIQAIESETERQKIFYEHIHRLQRKSGAGSGKRKWEGDSGSSKAQKVADEGSAAGTEDLNERRQKILQQLGLG